MPRDLTFFSYTGEAAARMVDRPADRAAAARGVIEAAVAGSRSSMDVRGQHDGLAINEVPDAVTAGAVALAVATTGMVSDLHRPTNCSTRTRRCWPSSARPAWRWPTSPPARPGAKTTTRWGRPTRFTARSLAYASIWPDSLRHAPVGRPHRLLPRRLRRRAPRAGRGGAAARARTGALYGRPRGPPAPARPARGPRLDVGGPLRAVEGAERWLEDQIKDVEGAEAVVLSDDDPVARSAPGRRRTGSTCWSSPRTARPSSAPCWGSFASHLVHNAPCEVVVVPPTPPGASRDR